MIFMWARDALINSAPPMPVQLRNRHADNWRPLIALADAFGAGWTEIQIHASIPHYYWFGSWNSRLSEDDLPISWCKPSPKRSVSVQ
jgi:hypothetical protein